MAELYGAITGWGAYAPPHVVTNHDLEATLDTSDEWIVQRTGIRQRHIAGADETTSTMAVKASISALAKANLPSGELDLILIATSSPDYFTPPVSSLVQAALNAHNTPAMTIVTGCTGFVYALVTADQFIRTGAYRNILVVGVELLSRFVNWQDRATSVLFGDAAGAVIVQATDRPCGVQGFVLGSDGSNYQHIIMPSGGSARPFGADVLAEGSHYLLMNGREVFKFATRIFGSASNQALSKAGMTIADVDWIIPHQANLRIIQAASKDMGVPMERFIINIDRYANTSAASIPLALAENIDCGRIKPTDTLLLVSFGAGMTWSAAVVQMQPIA
ncbi:MAG: 3-oxoacyl-[acyl-carrier-protein] synthase 3 [Chloroflexota bacterium]|nr:MAG: 3-oxoacyl-[acyl-carrier-protein] synthase 3 [Chloroflexota bacterium]